MRGYEAFLLKRTRVATRRRATTWDSFGRFNLFRHRFGGGDGFGLRGSIRRVGRIDAGFPGLRAAIAFTADMVAAGGAKNQYSKNSNGSTHGGSFPERRATRFTVRPSLRFNSLCGGFIVLGPCASSPHSPSTAFFAWHPIRQNHQNLSKFRKSTLDLPLRVV